jgi:hypothetical protein
VYLSDEGGEIWNKTLLLKRVPVNVVVFMQPIIRSLLTVLFVGIL